MMRKLHDIKRQAYPYGLTINGKITKVLAMDGSQVTVYLVGARLEQVKEFKYLGSVIQEQKIATTANIANRIGQAAGVFGSLKWCLWCKINVNIATKVRIYRSLILSVLLYGAESWTLLQVDLEKLKVFDIGAFVKF